MEVKHNFSKGLGKELAAPSELHSPANHASDLEMVIKEVLGMESFSAHPPQTGQLPRQHSSFHHFRPLLHNVNEDKLREWIGKSGKRIMFDQ